MVGSGTPASAIWFPSILTFIPTIFFCCFFPFHSTTSSLTRLQEGVYIVNRLIAPLLSQSELLTDLTSSSSYDSKLSCKPLSLWAKIMYVTWLLSTITLSPCASGKDGSHCRISLPIRHRASILKKMSVEWPGTRNWGTDFAYSVNFQDYGDYVWNPWDLVFNPLGRTKTRPQWNLSLQK